LADQKGSLATAISDGILGSLETYYSKMMEKNQYDITVDAVITNIDNKLDGIYRVKTDGAEFDAYASSGSYYKDDQVLVQIPNGNYGN